MRFRTLLVLLPLVLGAACVLVVSLFAQGPPPSSITVVSFGDSLISTGDEDLGWLSRHRAQIKLDLKLDVTASAFGQPGETSSDIVDRLRSDAQLRDAVRRANLVIFDAGINDFLYSRRAYYGGTCTVPDDSESCLDATEANFESNWKMIVKETRDLNPTSAIETMDIYYPVTAYDTEHDAYSTFLSYLTRMNRSIHQSGKRSGVAVANVYAAYNGPLGNQDPGKKNLILPDGFHPSPHGHVVLAASFRDLEFDLALDLLRAWRAKHV